MVDPKRYAQPPLVLVLAEVRHPETPAWTTAQIKEMKRLLDDVLPIHESLVRNDVTISVVPGAASPTQSRVRFESFRSREGHTALTVGARSYSLETGVYDGWDNFRALLNRVTTARAEVGLPDGVNRLGLRYLNEVRLPQSAGAVPDWAEWLNSQVIAPLPNILGLEVNQQQAVVQYTTAEENDTLTLRYGAVNGPPAVNGPIRRDTPGPGHYFLLDTDAAWTPSGTPEFLPNTICQAADRLHNNVEPLFESVLTDGLREVFDGR
ncbi:TIGR04255 family protein [Myceligenerans xiligouense]|uniref:Uncharacterized protein (TIGR04255 family) n=1 Tax=Myceligenerans xiligouense TaxID=253184 RepID=A0A3N4ZC18_9MICO|nr:TIGR04255 family protein [Myceligenerans xiligouense]RPF23418.1 uncharacterized protein (TIGR04255 family) [Myceligenerans xiligouense]